jgi:hypothetical protein
MKKIIVVFPSHTREEINSAETPSMIDQFMDSVSYSASNFAGAAENLRRNPP